MFVCITHHRDSEDAFCQGGERGGVDKMINVGRVDDGINLIVQLVKDT